MTDKNLSIEKQILSLAQIKDTAERDKAAVQFWGSLSEEEHREAVYIATSTISGQVQQLVDSIHPVINEIVSAVSSWLDDNSTIKAYLENTRESTNGEKTNP